MERRPRNSVFVLMALILASVGLFVWSVQRSDAPSFDFEIQADGVQYRDRIFADLVEQRELPFAVVENSDGSSTTLFMDVFLPAGDSSTDRPLFIAAFGGGYTIGERSDVEWIARDFAHRGYVAATIDYRLLADSPEGEAELVDASLRASHDAFAALRFLRSSSEEWGIRSDIGVLGGVSAGGFASAMNGTIDLGEDEVGPLALAFFDENGGIEGTVDGVSDPLSSVQGILNIAGGVFSLGPIDEGDAVLFSAHYRSDPIVPCGTSTEDPWGLGVEVSGTCALIERYDELGIAHGALIVEDVVGHGNFSPIHMDEIATGAAALFFEELLDG